MGPMSLRRTSASEARDSCPATPREPAGSRRERANCPRRRNLAGGVDVYSKTGPARQSLRIPACRIRRLRKRLWRILRPAVAEQGRAFDSDQSFEPASVPRRSFNDVHPTSVTAQPAERERRARSQQHPYNSAPLK